METALIKLAVIVLFGVVVGGGVYLVLFVDEYRRERAARLAALEQEVAEGTSLESAPAAAARSGVRPSGGRR